MQFDVHRNEDPDFAIVRYFILLQNDLIVSTSARVVAPLKVTRSLRAHPRLQPELVVDGEAVVMVTNELFTIDVRALGTVVANLNVERDRIIAALDFLFTGV